MFSQKTTSGGPHSNPWYYREVTEKMKPGCAQHCRVGGQEMTVYIETRGVQTGYREAFSPCEDSKWWDRLPREAVQSPALDIPRTCTDTVLRNLVWPHGFTQGIGEESSQDTCQPGQSSGPMKMLCHGHCGHQSLWPYAPLMDTQILTDSMYR